MSAIANIDTLYASVLVENYALAAGDLLDDLQKKLEKKFFTRSRTPDYVELGGINFKVVNGAYSWSYGLECSDFKLYLAQKENTANYPLYVEFRQEFLWQEGYQRAWDKFIFFLNRCKLRYVKSKISRADLCCHTDMPILKESYLKYIHYDPRCEHAEDWGDIDPVDVASTLVERWGKAEKFSGIRVGRGQPLMARIYDKSLEITHSKKEWFRAIWEREGLDLTKKIVNIEFEIKRDWYRMRNIDTVEELFSSLGSIWYYLTKNYLSFRRHDNERRSRRTMFSWWEKLRVIPFDFDGCLLSKRREAELNIDRAITGAMGYITSYAAAIGHNNLDKSVMLDLFRKINKMAMAKDINLEERIKQKKQRKLSPVNLDSLFNDLDLKMAEKRR